MTEMHVLFKKKKNLNHFSSDIDQDINLLQVLFSISAIGLL